MGDRRQYINVRVQLKGGTDKVGAKQRVRDALHNLRFVQRVEVLDPRDSQILADVDIEAAAKQINPHLCEPSCGMCGKRYSRCEC